MTTATPPPDIGIPRVKTSPDTGIHRSFTKGRTSYRVWWWENGVARSTRTKATTIEEARAERNRIYAEKLAAGARIRNRGAKTPQAKVRNARLRGTGREQYIRIEVEVRGVRVGSFATMQEAIEARDQYLKDQNELRRRLKALKRAIA